MLKYGFLIDSWHLKTVFKTILNIRSHCKYKRESVERNINLNINLIDFSYLFSSFYLNHRFWVDHVIFSLEWKREKWKFLCMYFYFYVCMYIYINAYIKIHTKNFYFSRFRPREKVYMIFRSGASDGNKL